MSACGTSRTSGDVTIELHWLEGRYDRAAALAEQLVRRQVAIIAVTGSTAVALAAKAASTTIPIVFAVGTTTAGLRFRY